jgi:hypothetical protein
MHFALRFGAGTEDIEEVARGGSKDALSHVAAA